MSGQGEHRRHYRFWKNVYKNNGAINRDSVEAAWTNRLTDKTRTRQKIQCQHAVYNSTTGDLLLRSRILEY